MSTPLNIRIVDEILYTFSSTDNSSHYPKEFNYSTDRQPNAIVGLWVDGSPRAIIGHHTGLSMVNDNSHIIIEGDVILIVGTIVLRYSLLSDRIVWQVEADHVTCFGLHHIAHHKIIIVHGELEIIALTYEGEELWRRGGAEILTGELSLYEDHLVIEDFNEETYKYSYLTQN